MNLKLKLKQRICGMILLSAAIFLLTLVRRYVGAFIQEKHLKVELQQLSANSSQRLPDSADGAISPPHSSTQEKLLKVERQQLSANSSQRLSDSATSTPHFFFWGRLLRENIKIELQQPSANSSQQHPDSTRSTPYLSYREKLLRENIKLELQQLSANLSQRLSEPADVTATPPHPCSIPTDLQQLCIETPQPRNPEGEKCSLEWLSKDCGLLKTIHGYTDKPVEPEEREFPLAFGLKMHKSPEQAEQLLRAIYRPQNVYCIHVDRNADDAVYRTMASIASCFDNVFMTERISFVYTSVDAFRAENVTMTCALQTGVPWKYYMNLAGQEFPLRTNLEIVRVLRLLNGTNDLESIPITRRYKYRVSYHFVVKEGKLTNSMVPKERPPFDAEMRKGSQYGAFARAFVESVFRDKTARSIMDYFNDTYSPDENIWATINQLPWIPGTYPHHVRHNPDNAHMSRAVVWQYFDKYRCKGGYVREVCIFDKADLPWLLRQPNLFANKFRTEKDSQAVKCLEAVVDQRTRSRGLTLNETFYRNLPHFRYRNKLRP